MKRIEWLCAVQTQPRIKGEFRTFVNAYIDRDEDATVAEWKLRGEWPGWGWITKEVKKRKLKI